MEENVVIAPSELIATPIKMALPIKIKDGISIINENPLGVLEKLGKYEFIYDYKVPSFLDSINYLKPYSVENTVKAYPKSSSGFYNFDSDGTGGLKNVAVLFPQTVKVNSEPQVGTFSKGNIVNVLRFDGNNAIIQNPNFVEPDPTAVKTFWSGLNVDLKNRKEFTVPKDYLRKVDDNLAVTVSTGILYGANMKPQPVYNYPIKTLPTNPINQTILEENASFVLARDFQYVSGYGSSYCSPDGMCTADMSPKYSTLNAGTKVTGRLFRETNNTLNKLQMGAIMPPNYNDYLAVKPNYNDYLAVKGYGSKGSINIPIEYLTRLGISNNLITDNNTIVTVISLVDKKRGKCNETGYYQTENYDPCRVSAVKGKTYNGYISGGSFYGTDGEAFLPINEYKIIEKNSGSGNNKNNGVVLPAEDNNKNLLMIVGAFLLGYVLFGKDKPTT
jgi:hypothetical protein